jgi:hypothetical protein
MNQIFDFPTKQELRQTETRNPECTTLPGLTYTRFIRLDAPVASMVDLSVVANLRATLAARRGIIVL